MLKQKLENTNNLLLIPLELELRGGGGWNAAESVDEVAGEGDGEGERMDRQTRYQTKGVEILHSFS